jgi:hypothetical protein
VRGIASLGAECSKRGATARSRRWEAKPVRRGRRYQIKSANAPLLPGPDETAVD